MVSKPGEAAAYLRERIGRARETVLIVDPCFAGRELLAFGHAIRGPDVELRILTSVLGLKKDARGRRSRIGRGSKTATHRGFPPWRRFTNGVACITEESF